MSGTKDLDYFIANPDEMPTDDATLEALLGGGTAEPTEQDVNIVSSDEVDPKTGATGTDPNGNTDIEGDELDDDDKPVMTKDGKHALPYSVLRSERERRQAAERMLQDMQAQLNSLQERAAGNGTNNPAVGEEPIISAEDMEALREDFPAFAQVLDQLTGKIGTLQSQLNVVAEREAQEQAQQAERQAAAVRDTVQSAIDGNSVLSFWQAEKPKMFEIAIAYDNEAKKDPKFQGMTMDQRFEKVVELVESDYGKTVLPEGYGKAAAPSQQTDDTLAAKARAALKKAGAFKPRTLSDLPGGMPPASSDPENLDRMSVGDLAAMMDRMSPDQIAALTSKIG